MNKLEKRRELQSQLKDINVQIATAEMMHDMKTVDELYETKKVILREIQKTR